MLLQSDFIIPETAKTLIFGGVGLIVLHYIIFFILKKIGSNPKYILPLSFAKKIRVPLLLFLAFVFTYSIGFSSAFSQQEIDSLTLEQLELRKSLKTTKKANKLIFLNILTAEQKKIFEDESINKKERRKIIKSSLSEKQQKELKGSRVAMQNTPPITKCTQTHKV